LPLYVCVPVCRIAISPRVFTTIPSPACQELCVRGTMAPVDRGRDKSPYRKQAAARYRYHPKYVLPGRVIYERVVGDPIRSDPHPREL